MQVWASGSSRRSTLQATPSNVSDSQHSPYSAICAVAKDENRYVHEWVHYHQCLGVGHIYLYDHGSVRPLSDEVQAFIDQGYLTYTSNITGLAHTKFKEGFSSNLERFMTTIQGQVYKHCLERYGQRHTFVGLIDVDEFVVLLDEALVGINQLLRRYEAQGGVSLYWTLLGSSGHDKPPRGGVIHAYQRCTPAGHHVNTQFKSFVNTRFSPVMYSPHRARFLQPPLPPLTMGAGVAAGMLGKGAHSSGDGGTLPASAGANSNTAGAATAPGEVYLVNELGQPIPKGRNKQGSHQRATVYHYATRSKADFLAKLRRGGGAGVTRPPHYLRRLDKQCTETCTGAVDTYLRACRARGMQSLLDKPA